MERCSGARDAEGDLTETPCRVGASNKWMKQSKFVAWGTLPPIRSDRGNASLNCGRTIKSKAFSAYGSRYGGGPNGEAEQGAGSNSLSTQRFFVLA